MTVKKLCARDYGSQWQARSDPCAVRGVGSGGIRPTRLGQTHRSDDVVNNP